MLRRASFELGVSRRISTRLTLVSLLALVGAVGAASTALADARVTRAELDGTRLRIEGTAIANRVITVDGVALGTSDGSGTFRIERDPFTKPADCTVDVNDGSATPTNVTLSGCTVGSPSPPPPPLAASAFLDFALDGPRRPDRRGRG